MNRYLAIDFETANSSPLSACAIGYTLIEDGTILVSDSMLIKPPIGYDNFNYHNTKVHHITSSMVYDEPTFDKVYATIEPYFINSIIVAHNASFDIRVLSALKEAYGLCIPCINYLCTVSLSRLVYPDLCNHKLDTVSNYLNISLNHHEAGSDAYACAMIVYNVEKQFNISSIEELLSIYSINLKQLV
ncbi:MAG: 3'-5' exonuclease [Erysipelotrichaceae bacterium]